jgi:hypothetical protein
MFRNFITLASQAVRIGASDEEMPLYEVFWLFANYRAFAPATQDSDSQFIAFKMSNFRPQSKQNKGIRSILTRLNLVFSL